MGTGCATPRTLIRTLENQDKHLEDVQMYHFLVKGAIRFEGGSPKTKFYHKAFFVDSDMQKVIKQGKGDYIPISIAQVPNLLKSGGLSIDVALVQVSMPDQHGFVSLGVTADITHAVIQKAAIVIAELNPNMPRTNSPEGKPIICLASTTEDGKESRIAPSYIREKAFPYPAPTSIIL